jgi:hypothetical protein
MVIGTSARVRTKRLIWGTRLQPGDRNYLVWCGEKWRKEVLFGMHCDRFLNVEYVIFGENPNSNNIKCFPDLVWTWRKNKTKTDEEINKIMKQSQKILKIIHKKKEVSLSQIIQNKILENMNYLNTINILLKMKLIEKKNNNYSSLIPIFTPNDIETFNPIINKVVNSVTDIIQNSYYDLEAIFTKTTVFSNNIALQETLNRIYHQIYSQTINQLINERSFASIPTRPDGNKYLPYVTLL